MNFMQFIENYGAIITVVLATITLIGVINGFLKKTVTAAITPVKESVEKIKDNHLPHIQDSVTNIEKHLAVIDTRCEERHGK